ncbi:MAG: tripartite tricarboxylate transporter substrate binding protein [Salinarimonadaceae bacterium]|nr:MAG: tripartite tricarboxylate transporter substrate binding protein [Salinarimonadaceae bacterium]
MFNQTKKLLATVAVLMVGTASWAQDYPTKTVNVVVTYSAGGTTDILTRILVEELSEELGQPFVVENRPGGGTVIGTASVVQAPADGYTLVVAAPAFTVNPSLRKSLPFSYSDDLVPVARFAATPYFVIANAELEADDLTGLVELAKADPGAINYASAGVNGATHLTGELFNLLAGVELTHVPYNGTGPAVLDLVRGDVQVMFVGLPATQQHIDEGTLKVLAVISSTPVAGYENIPTSSESGLGRFEAEAWFGIMAPAGTPSDVVQTLSAAIEARISTDAFKARLENLGAIESFLGPEAFGEFLSAEETKWREVIEAAGIEAQ